MVNEDLKELKDSDIPDKFKGVSLVKIINGEEQFSPFNKLIKTLNLFFTYDVDLYDELLDFLHDNYVIKLKHNNITSKEALYPVMMNIKEKLDNEGLSNYLFTGDTSQLQPFDIFRSVELLSTATSHFQEEEFTSKVVAKGMSFLTSKEDMKKMFTHLKHYPFNVVYGDLVGASIDRDNVAFFEYLITDHDDKKDIKDIRIDNNSCINYSALKGNLNFIKYFHKQGGIEVLNTEVCKKAAQNGHINCIQYVYEKMGPRVWNENICSSAARGGHLDCLKYAHENGCPWDKETTINAAANGHLDCIKYAHENGGPGIWDKKTCKYAAKGGHLDCLKYAHEHGCPWDKKTCKYAARGGYLDCLKYAHEQGCPWDETTCSNAARGGHLDCLKYAHEHGCPWDERTCNYATKNCLKYARDNGLNC